MRVAICGYPPLAEKVMTIYRNSDLEFTNFVSNFTTNRGETLFQINLPVPESTPPPFGVIDFFEFRRMIESGALDGLVICETNLLSVKKMVKMCKLYEIPNVGVTNIAYDHFYGIYWLSNNKIFMHVLETNIIDSCNLNCKGCAHYASLFNDSDFYPLADFTRDIEQISKTIDVPLFYLLGGEPFKLSNLDEYLKITKRFLPKSRLGIVTNGLLIPRTPKHILDALRENNFTVEVSMYRPTISMINEIVDTFEKNNIPYITRNPVGAFAVDLTLHGGHNPIQSRAVCCNDGCRFLRNGKIYKCPSDALSFRFAERFGIKGFPSPTGVDIFSANCATLIESLDENVELCFWCNERARYIPWTPENKPALTDWLADPSELERLQN